MSSSGPSSRKATGSSSGLAQRYEDEKERITKSCFARLDENGQLLESYITHVRITEDGHYPSSRPPPNANESSKKPRVIIVSVRKSGRVRVHKSRENPNGTFQIGKTWNLDELSKIENDPVEATGFTVHLGKPYYWVTATPKEKSVFIGSLVKIYKKYTGGKIPELVGVDTTGHPLNSNSPEQQPKQHHHHHHHHMPHFHQKSRQGSAASSSDPRGTPPLNASSSAGTSPANSRHASASNVAQMGSPVESRGPQTPSQQVSHHPPSVNSSQTNFSDQHTTPGSPAVATRKRSSTTPMAEPPALEFDNNNTSNSPQPQATRNRAHSSAHKRRSSLFGLAGGGVAIPALGETAAAEEISVDTENQENQENIPMATSSPIDGTPLPASSNNSYSETGDSTAFSKGHGRNRSSVHDVRLFARVSHHEDQEEQEYQPEDVQDDREVELDQPTLQEPEPEPEPVSEIGYEVQDADNANHSTPTTKGHSRQRSVGFSDSLEPQGELLGDELNNQHQVENGLEASSIDRSKSRESLVSKNRLSFTAQKDASAVEETLGEFNWTGRDDFKTLESNITNELAVIEAANLHNVVDLDDRLDELDNSLSAAISECEKLDTMLAFFSVQLGSFGDDITHIESQGQGLQVQTTNQKLLWNELHSILQTVSLPEDLLSTLKHAKLDSIKDLSITESALVELYGALKMSGDSANDSLGGMRALREKRHVYERTQMEFTQQFRGFVDHRFKRAMQDCDKELSSVTPSEEAQLHQIEPTFMRSVFPLSGVILFLKETDQNSYMNILKGYESLIKAYYESAIGSYLAKSRRGIAALLGKVEKFAFTGKDQHHHHSTFDGGIAKTLKRSGTLARLRSDSKSDVRNNNLNSNGNVGGASNGNGMNISGGNSGAGNNGASNDELKGWKPDAKIRGQIKTAINKVIFSICSVLTCQQEVLILLFHQSSFTAIAFPDFVKKYPVNKRVSGKSSADFFNFRDIDSDRGQARDLQNAMNSIFAPMQDDMVKFVDFLGKNSSLDTPYLVASLEVQMNSLQTTNQDYLMHIITRLRDRAVSMWQQFIETEIQNVSNTLVSSKKRRGVVYFVKQLPGFCREIEKDLSEVHTNEVRVEELPVRQLVDDSYDKVFKAVFHNLQRIAKEPSTANNESTFGSLHASPSLSNNTSEYEDKERLNYHIMMIENMNVLKEGLNDLVDNAVLKSHQESALVNYKTELDNYIQMVIRRPLGKLIEFIDGVEALIEKNPGENPSARHGYSRSTLKRVLSGYDAKEIRKGVDVLFKRVEKHFLGEFEERAGKDPQLFNKVWSALQAQYSSLHSRLVQISDRYYPGSDGEAGSNLIEFSKNDVTTAFNKQ